MTEELEATYLRSLRLVVVRQAETNGSAGIMTPDRQESINKANRLMGLAQADVIQRYLDEYAEELADSQPSTDPSL
jgi:hypothetical protein